MSIGARPMNRKVLRMRNELGCHTMHRWLPTRHASCTYTTNHPTSPSLTSSPDARRRLRRAASKQKVVPGRPSLRPLQAFGPSISLFSSPSFFPFLLPVCRTPTSTPPSVQPSSASWLLHCTSQISFLPLRTDWVVFPCSIFGILSMQCYTYYHRYPLDRPFYKMLVRTRSQSRRIFLTPVPVPSD